MPPDSSDSSSDESTDDDDPDGDISAGENDFNDRDEMVRNHICRFLLCDTIYSLYYKTQCCMVFLAGFLLGSLI